MSLELNDLAAFLAVARAGGFRDAARSAGLSPSGLSVAVRRLEAQVGVRLLNRTTRSVSPTEAGQRLIERLSPALSEMEAALDILNGFRDRPAGTLKLNVPMSVAQLVLPPIMTGFLKAYPDIRLEVVVEDSFVDVLAAGCDAGIRYGERLEQDMVALPIGPATQRFITAASPAYLEAHGWPEHPRELLNHACLRGQFASGRMLAWEFEKDGETVRVDPRGPLVIRPAAALDLMIEAAREGLGVVHLFEGMLRPDLDSGRLVPVLETWSPAFPGPFLYYPGRRLLPAPLRAFVDFVKHVAG